MKIAFCNDDKTAREHIVSLIKLAKSLIDKIPESHSFYVLSYLQRIAVSNETPNADTLEAFT